MSATAVRSPFQTVGDLASRLGPDMPLSRIRFNPPPGEATEQDVIDLCDHEDRLYELADGVLVEKAMGFSQSCLTALIITALETFNRQTQLGIVTAPDGAMRPKPGLVRIPDIAFISWDRLPTRQIPTSPIPTLAPDLAVEVLSASNTLSEMDRKRQEYFRAGTKLVWEVDPDTRTVTVYTSPDQSTVLHETDTLRGGVVLTGFSLPLRELFAELDPC